MAMHQGQGSTSETKSNDTYSRLEVKAYAKVDAAESTRETKSRCTPVMVSITGLSGTVEQRAPVDIVLVLHVHVRCIAPENWHYLLNEATKLVVEKLGGDDRLAIVPSLSKETRIIFEDAVIVPVKPKLLPMTSENKAAACNAVMSSEAMRSNTSLLRDLESAEAILYRRESKDKDERAGYIIVVSNSNEDLSSLLTWRFRNVHAFGFRNACNARTMYTIASSIGSTYDVLDDNDGISQAFVSIVDKIRSAVEPVVVHLRCNEEVVLSAIHAPRICYFISYDKKIGMIWANARCGMATNIIIRLDIPKDYHEDKYGSLLNIQVKHGHPPNPVKGPPLVIVRKGMEGSKEVAAEMVRTEVVKIVAEISVEDKEGSEELDGVALADRLRNQRKNVDDSDYGKEADEAGLTRSLAEEMQEMETRLDKNNLWLEYMLSWLSRQWWPRHQLIKDQWRS